MIPSRETLYEPRIQRYLDLYASIKTQDPIEQSLVAKIALQRVLDDKLKQLVEDPRSLNEMTGEIIQTKAELADLNEEINQLLGGEEEGGYILNSPTIENFNKKLLETKELIDNIEKDKKTLVALQTLESENKNAVSPDFLFIKKNVSEELERKEQQKVQALDILRNTFHYLKHRKIRAFYEVLKAKAIEDNALSEYRYSRVGKIMGIQYTISQIIIMTFLGILLLSTLGTSPLVLGLVIPIMILGVPATGISNWWLFRGLVAKTLIILRNMFRTPTDVQFTLWQKIKLGIVAIICCVSGFLAAYAFYILLIGLTPALLEFLGLATFFAGVVVAAPWLVPLLMGVIVLPIFIGSAVAVATYFYKAAYEPTLRGKVWEDVCAFFSALFETDDIRGKLDLLRMQARERFSHYYQGQALEDKVNNVVNDSTIGTILNKNQGLDKKAIIIRGCVTVFLVVLLIPGMIGGIIATQLLAHADLSTALHWVHGFADYLSWGICTMAGIAYTPVLVSGGSRCVVDIVFGVEKSAGKTVTAWEKFKFQWVRGWNSSMNFGEGVFGYILKKADKLIDFASEAQKVLGSLPDLILGTYLTVAAGVGSFITNTIQGPPTHYEEDLDDATVQYNHAEQDLATYRGQEPALTQVEGEIKGLQTTFAPLWQAKKSQNEPSNAIGYQYMPVYRV